MPGPLCFREEYDEEILIYGIPEIYPALHIPKLHEFIANNVII